MASKNSHRMARPLSLVPTQTRCSCIFRRNTSKQLSPILLPSRHTLDSHRPSSRSLGTNIFHQRVPKVLPLVQIHSSTVVTHCLHGALPGSIFILSSHSFADEQLHTSNPHCRIPTNDPPHLSRRPPSLRREIRRGRDAQSR
jgi:hypothetical protein